MKIVVCKNCGDSCLKTKHRYNESIKNDWNFFCSKSCKYGYQKKGIEIPCAQCQRMVTKPSGEIRKTKKHVFCSKSGAAIFNNKNKTHCIRRSRLEKYIEQCIREEFPNINLLCNTNDYVDAELDIYFPDLELALEFNGIVHYKPIYGQNKLESIQNKDRKRSEQCLKNGIELYVFDTSQESRCDQRMLEKYWQAVKELVTSFQKRAGHTNE